MNLSILNIEFAFKSHNDSPDEFTCTSKINDLNVHITINKEYFENKDIDWNFIENFLTHFIRNIDFINEKSKKISRYLYNEYGNKTIIEDKFSIDNCRFTNQLFVELEQPSYLYPYPQSLLTYCVENMIDSEFTYLTNICKFTDYKSAFFVGVNGSSIED